MEIENNSFSRLLRLSNEFDISGSVEPARFINNLARMTETNRIIRAVVKSVSFDNNVYNIYTSGEFKNNQFKWDINGIPYSYSVSPSGFYTAQELINILQPEIETALKGFDAGAVLTMVIGDYSGKIEYSTNTATASLVLDGGLELNSVLGNTALSSAILLGSPFTSQSLPALAGLQNVYVHSTTIGEGNLVDGDVENHDVIAEVPVDAPWGSRVNYESRDDELDSVNYGSLRNFDSIEISLRDLQNRQIQLNGGNVVIVLKIYYL
jgi:hypothetical protein